MDSFYPTVRYHPTLAPKGQVFKDADAFAALSDEWVDTPTKFPAETPALDVLPVFPRRSRKSKETV